MVLVLLGAVPASAQTDQQKRLKGLTAVNVVIGLTGDSASCGITETGLTTAASKALLDNGVRVEVDEFSLINETPDLWVEVTSFIDRGDQQCVSDIDVELFVFLYATPDHSEQPVIGRFTLANVIGSNYSHASADGQRIRDIVFEYVEEIAVDIRVANQ